MVDPAIAEVYSMHDARPLPRRILIVRLGAMGDVLHALPAVHLLRTAIPNCEIGWVIERRWLPLLCAPGHPLFGPLALERPLVNDIHVVDTRAWRRAMGHPSTWREVSKLISAMRQKRYELAIDFQGAIKSAVLASLSGADGVVGFVSPRESAARMFYSNAVQTELPHVVDMNFALAREVIGKAISPPRTLLPFDAKAELWAETFAGEHGFTRFAILAPTAGWRAKEWPLENFASVAKALAAEGTTSLINFGPGEESVAERLRELSGDTAKPLACDLSQLIAITRRASLFVGGDTGPMHLAAALQVPVIALFGPTDPARNGPYSPQSKVLRSSQSVTSYSHVATRDEGLALITPEQVLAAAAELLK